MSWFHIKIMLVTFKRLTQMSLIQLAWLHLVCTLSMILNVIFKRQANIKHCN